MSQRIDELFFKIIACKQEHQRDLKRIWQNCKRTEDEISKEDVICRRKGRDTARMIELKQELEADVNLLEQYLVFATLLSG